MLPLIDIVFLLLVFFIYAMLSMAVHHSLPVALPSSSAVSIDRAQLLSVTVKADGAVFVEETPVSLAKLRERLRGVIALDSDQGVMLFADHRLTYQGLFVVLDAIRQAGVKNINLQADVEH